jgi:hypothetical protein
MAIQTIHSIAYIRRGPSESCFIERFMEVRDTSRQGKFFKILRIETTSSCQWECIEPNIHGYQSV